MKFKNILIVGATGSTGKHVVEQAIGRGHQVTALIRPAKSLHARDGLEVIHGQVLDTAALEKAVAGKDAVVSCLGISRRNSGNPWTKLLSPPDFLEKAADSIVAAMTTRNVSRLVAISAGGAGDSLTRIDGPTRFLFRISKIGQTVADAGRMEARFADSDLDWYAARPMRLVDGPVSGRMKVLERGRISDKTIRADLAAWVLDALEHEGPFTTRAEMVGFR